MCFNRVLAIQFSIFLHLFKQLNSIIDNLNHLIILSPTKWNTIKIWNIKTILLFCRFFFLIFRNGWFLVHNELIFKELFMNEGINVLLNL